MARVYIETTIPSFLAARRSRQVILAGKQQTTLVWWERRRPHFEIFVSALVLDEVAMGDRTAADRRLRCLEGLPVLAVDAEVVRLAQGLLAAGAVAVKAATDASHIAVAARHGMDFLLTWNCTHIANAQTLPRVRAAVEAMGYELPVICTPDELMEDPYE